MELLAGIGPGQEQEAVDQSRQAIGLLEHAADGLPVALGVPLVLKRHLSHRADGRERRAQLVRGVRGEAPELGDGVLDARQGEVEHAGQLAELVLGVLDDQALAEVVHGQPLRLTREPIERRQGRGRPASGLRARRWPRPRGGPAGCPATTDATRGACPPRSGPPGARRARCRSDACRCARARACRPRGGARSARAPGARWGGRPGRPARAGGCGSAAFHRLPRLRRGFARRRPQAHSGRSPFSRAGAPPPPGSPRGGWRRAPGAARSRETTTSRPRRGRALPRGRRHTRA